MPVWHEATKQAREAGKLRVVAITQEQHPARCRLFARWKNLDIPILWDPFNLTASKAVPNFTLVDEHGVIRARRARVKDLEGFLQTDYYTPKGLPAGPDGPADLLVQGIGAEAGRWHAMSRTLWNRSADPSGLIEVLEREPKADRSPDDLFHLGVAYRLRHDSEFVRAGDFSAAVSAWQHALRARPDQYIWRRRLQQYGPLTDKPYPFYGWIQEAQAALRARGEAEEPLDAALTLSEQSRAVGSDGVEVLTKNPDPDGGIPADVDDLLVVQAAMVFDTTGRTRVGRLHLEVRPRAQDLAAWHGGTDPLVVWIDVPSGWRAASAGLARDLTESAANETIHFELDVEAPEGAEAETTLHGYVLAPICRAADGTCLYVRKPWTLRSP